MTAPRLRRPPFAALVAALAVMAGGCGHSGAHHSSSSHTTTATVTPSVPAVVTVPSGRRGITGASQATCAPGGCLPGGAPVQVALPAVSNGDGTSSSRQYAVLRPRGLAASPANRAPAVLVFYAGANCGYDGMGRWPELAVADRFVVVAMEVPCSRAPHNWLKRNVDTPAPRSPSDQPYVRAVVQAIVRCPGQCVDPRRIYAVGLSSGGNMVADIMCDAQNSALFRGFLIDSATLALWNGVPDCPTTNVGFFVTMALSNYSVDAQLFYGRSRQAHLNVPEFAAWASRRLRCRSTLQRSTLGTAQVYSYGAPCAFATHGVAVQALEVINGGHGWGCQDSDPGAPPHPCPGMSDPPGLAPNGLPRTGGLFIEQAFWQQVAAGGS